jgi:hypothetical protein
MSGYTFGAINLPGPAGTYVYISVAGVDAAGLAVGNYGDSNNDFHGFTANSATPVIFDPPNSSNTNVGGVTSSGEIFGNDTNFQNQQVGFVYNNGTFTVIDAPLAQATTVFGVTNGEVFGGYVDVLGGSHGFLDNNGAYAQVDAPGATSTTIMGVTPSGELAGTFIDSSDVVHGFIDKNGTFTTIDAPGSSGTYVVGISANGVVAGTYDDNANNQYGFTDINGVISTISITGAIGTAVTGINASGEVVGYYIDSAGNVHGFVDIGGIITTVDLPGATQTDIQGVNDAGDIYGFYNDSTGQQHGFVGTGTASPTVSSIAANVPNGTTSATTGQTVTVTVTVNEAMTVTGTPTLQLNDNEVATYASGSGTSTLTFTYMVQGTDISTDLQVTGLNLPAGASIADSSGNQLTSSVTANLAIAANTTLFPFANNSDITEAIYIGYFNRAGDPSGDAYWLGQLSSGNLSVTGVAASFSVQPETTAVYPFLANQSAGSPETVTSPNGWSLSVPTNIYNFINTVYENLFDRSALADSTSTGLAYWTNQLQSNAGNAQAVASFILNVTSGAGGADQLTIANKVTVADYFTANLAAAGLNFTSAADALAHSAIASVTSALSTVLAAEATINTFLAAPSSSAEVALVGTSTTDAVSGLH